MFIEHKKTHEALCKHLEQRIADKRELLASLQRELPQLERDLKALQVWTDRENAPEPREACTVGDVVENHNKRACVLVEPATDIEGAWWAYRLDAKGAPGKIVLVPKEELAAWATKVATRSANE